MNIDLIYECRALSYTLLSKLNIQNHADSHITLPLYRYIMSVFCAIPVRHIILGERPYATNVLPFAASAMSYDPDRQSETLPSVHYIARDIANHHDMEYEVAREWFQDSWKYLNKGIMLLNVCTYTSFMDPFSDRERVAVEEFIRDIINVSYSITKEAVHLYPMGNPAQHSAGRMRSSLKDPKLRVKVHKCMNPAWPSHKTGDQQSPQITLSNKPAIKLLYHIVKSTHCKGALLTERSYEVMSSSRSTDELSDLVNRIERTSDGFERIEAMFKDSGKRREEMTAEQVLAHMKTELKGLAMALQSVKIRSLFAAISEPEGVAKQTFYNQRQQYKPRESHYGTSSKAPSVMSTPRGPSTTVPFADDDDSSESGEANPPTHDPLVHSRTTVPTTPTPPTKRVSAPHKAPSVMSSVGSPIGFIDEESEPSDNDDVASPSLAAQLQSLNVATAKPLNLRGNSSMTPSEVLDMTDIADFVESSDEYQYNVDVVDALNEAVRTRSAPTGIAAEALDVIRNTKSDPKSRAIADALGNGSGLPAQDMGSKVMQWLISHAV